MELSRPWVWAALGVLGAGLLVQSARLWWRGASSRWRLRVRAQRAARGERDAARLLARAGYRVCGAQVRAELEYRLDGAPRVVEVQADYLVERNGERFVAEVKTGREAPHLSNRATRRQLLEYAHAFDATGVLLVDAERGRVHRVTLPARRGAASRAISRDLAFLLIGAAIGALGALAAAGLLAR